MTARAPKLTWAMLKTVDLHSSDPHLIVKQVNELIEAIIASDEGRCPHRPANLAIAMRGDFAHKANGSYCMFCSQEIEIERIVWRTKDKLPSPPQTI